MIESPVVTMPTPQMDVKIEHGQSLLIDVVGGQNECENVEIRNENGQIVIYAGSGVYQKPFSSWKPL
jgi:hypothetical protein